MYITKSSETCEHDKNNGHNTYNDDKALLTMKIIGTY